MIRLICTIVLLFTVAFAVGPASAGVLGNGDLAVMGEFRATVQVVEREFPEITGSIVKTAELQGNVYAITVPGKIFVNTVYARDAKMFERSIANDVAIGWHPRLGHCSAEQLLAYHEAAHLVDAEHGRIARFRLIEEFGDGTQLRDVLPTYSFRQDTNTINPGEALAEAFAAVRCNGGNSTERELNRLLTD